MSIAALADNIYLRDSYFKQIKDALEKEKKAYPRNWDIITSTYAPRIDDSRLVLGEDKYVTGSYAAYWAGRWAGLYFRAAEAVYDMCEHV